MGGNITYKIRADVFKQGKNGCISFQVFSATKFNEMIAANNYSKKFKKHVEEFYDMKGCATCYICELEENNIVCVFQIL